LFFNLREFRAVVRLFFVTAVKNFLNRFVGGLFFYLREFRAAVVRLFFDRIFRIAFLEYFGGQRVFLKVHPAVYAVESDASI
jgi:hypothetical protein